MAAHIFFICVLKLTKRLEKLWLILFTNVWAIIRNGYNELNLIALSLKMRFNLNYAFSLLNKLCCILC